MATFLPLPTLSTIQGTLPVSKGGTNATSWTAGSVPYAVSSTALGEANGVLYFDGTRLGIGTTRTGAISGTNPLARIKGTGATSSTGAFDVQNSAGTEHFAVRDDGQIRVAAANTGYLYATAGVVSYDSRLAYINSNATLVLTDSNFRTVQTSNPVWIGGGRGGEVSNGGTVGGFRVLITKNLTANDSNIDACSAFRILVNAGNNTEDGTAYATLQTNSAGSQVNVVRLQSSGDAHFTRNVVIGDSALTASMGASAAGVMMLLSATAPTGNGTGFQMWWDGTNLKYRTPGGTTGNIV